jgi:hypothetical protein
MSIEIRALNTGRRSFLAIFLLFRHFPAARFLSNFFSINIPRKPPVDINYYTNGYYY